MCLHSHGRIPPGASCDDCARTHPGDDGGGGPRAGLASHWALLLRTAGGRDDLRIRDGGHYRE